MEINKDENLTVLFTYFHPLLQSLFAFLHAIPTLILVQTSLIFYIPHV